MLRLSEKLTRPPLCLTVCWAPMQNQPGMAIQAVPDQMTGWQDRSDLSFFPLQRAVGHITEGHITSVLSGETLSVCAVRQVVAVVYHCPTGVLLPLRNAERKPPE